MPADGVAITLDGVRKRFGKVEAVKEMTTEIREGEFVGLADGLAFKALAGDVMPERVHELLRRFEAEQLGVEPESLEAHGTAERLSA